MTDSPSTAEEGNNNKEVSPKPTDIIPQLATDGITQAELETTIKVLNAVAKLNRKQNNNSNNNNKKRKKSCTNNSNSHDDETTTHEQEALPLQQQDGLDLYKQSNFRPLRKVLAQVLELHKRTMFQGKQEEEHYEQRKLERSLKRQKRSEASLQQKHIADTALRRGRVEKLNSLKSYAKDEEESKLKILALMVPDGHVDTTTTEANDGSNRNRILLKDYPEDTVVVQVETVQDEDDAQQQKEGEETIKLPKCRSCYVCKIRYRELHHFYDQLCPSCAALNWEKRHQSADMTGRIAVVTGSRVKIGFQTCLKLLRAGAAVVATTRFPNAAAHVYRRESDFDQWKDRLQIYGLDLRDVTGLEAFTRFLKMRYPHGIDVVINNACQTIRRPRGFYVPLVEKEQRFWQESDETHKNMLQGCMQFETLRRKLHDLHSGNNGSTIDNQHLIEPSSSDGAPLLLMGMDHVTTNTANGESNGDKKHSAAVTLTGSSSKNDASNFEHSGLSHSAAMSQMVILPEDVGVSDDILPSGMSDVNGHQLDLRTQNSWLLKMEDVSTPEVMECMFINAIAPFVLNSRLKPLMTIPQDDKVRPDRFVINVSAMEGKFYRYKMANHPHTNMAKAALNMMTRTSAEELAKKHRIYMNSVDTGWINDENPLEKASKIAVTNLFQTPIDEVDAASRILDPIFSGINAGRDCEKDFGKFLKDYRETEW